MGNKLQPVRLNDIQAGKPLAWSVYDKFGNLLLREGNMVESQRQIEGLSENGLFREKKYAAASRSVAAVEPVYGKTVQAEQFEDLQSIKLGIGDAVQLQDFSNTKQRYYVRLIGFMNKKSVLVSHPTLNEKLCFIKEGSAFLVRGFSGTKTYEFNTNVIGVCLSPFSYLHLAYPAQVKTTNMRGAVRVKLKLVCSVELQATGQKMPATIEDMSISGARAHAKKAFGQVGDEITLTLRLQIDNENQILTIPALIRNVTMENDGPTGEKIVMHGLEFVQTVNMDLMVLQNFIYKRMLNN